MAKNSEKQIKRDEKKIIAELQTNANSSINDIAIKCGFSRQKVWRIIKNLEKNNTIWGYTAVVDSEKQNMKKYYILIKRTNIPVNKEIINKIISRELKKSSEELGVHLMTSSYTNGAYDYIICIDASDIKGAKRFVENLNRLFGDAISEILLIEEMFCVQKCGIQNPEIERFKEFFDIE